MGTAPSKSARTAGPPKTDLTPAMRQYVEQKQQVGDAILLFRMGDFYETFYEDARTISQALGIALTSRSKGGDNEPIPLAGIPHHALETYLTRLVQAGFRVAISEQVEDPKLAKGVVKREVVRIITAGTLTDEALLDERADNVLTAVCDDGRALGVAAIELSSGRCQVFDIPDRAVLDELVRLGPAEFLIDEESATDSRVARLADELLSLCQSTITRRAAHEFVEYNAEQTLRDHFGVATLAGFGFDQMTPSLRAAGAILAYLKETQKTALSHITTVRRHVSDTVVQIDHNTWRSLEIERTLRGGAREGSLLAAVDRTVHPIGARLLRRWLRSPLRRMDAIAARQDTTAYFVERQAVRRNVRLALKSMSDVERIAARVAMLRATPRDLAGLGNTLNRLPDLRRQLGDTLPALLADLTESLGGLEDVADLLEKSIRPDAPSTVQLGGIIRDAYDQELDRLHAIGRDGQDWLARYQHQQAEATGIPSLKVGFNKVFGYYIEVSHAHQERVPPDYVRKQTVKNAERYITDELKRFETEVLTAEEKARDLEAALFERIRAQVAERIKDLLRVADAVGQLDVLAGLAELAVRQRYVRPALSEELALHLRGGRHPVLEQSLADGFVPNDCHLDADEGRLLIITGPNMAGKSTYIRQVALIALLAQTGSFVPADEMTFSPVDRIFARVGASDEIARGQSTFMVEMTESANILNNATPQSLVVLDELGRGTSTFDGLSLAWAITEHLANNVRCLTLMATHYHELTELSDLLGGVKNYNVAVRESTDADGHESIVFLHRIVPGGTDKSYGLHVARLAGVPADVVTRSREVLAELERGFQRETKTTPLSRKRTKKDDAQLMLFTDPAEQVAKDLQSLDVNALTPLDALAKLKGFQDRLQRP
ncbi:MAG TPA: DNA mismatch repair protein MutS [Phycisphaerae bacterium]|nr:DNA mismatch repair protein MutS [Phycisphaerae bacterium]